MFWKLVISSIPKFLSFRVVRTYCFFIVLLNNSHPCICFYILRAMRVLRICFHTCQLQKHVSFYGFWSSCKKQNLWRYLAFIHTWFTATKKIHSHNHNISVWNLLKIATISMKICLRSPKAFRQIYLPHILQLLLSMRCLLEVIW